jgi:predicted SprT family Zn-dependent metalloprotease
MTTQYITVDEAEMISKEVFDTAISAFMKFAKQHPAIEHQLAKIIVPFTIVRWKKFGFRCAGRACRKTVMGKEILWIEMNINYLSSKDWKTFIANTLIHELAHILAWNAARSWGHDKAWKAIARAMGDDGSRCHNYATPENKPARKQSPGRVRTDVKCPCCGKVYSLTPLMLKRTSVPGQYRCACGSDAAKFIRQ